MRCYADDLRRLNTIRPRTVGTHQSLMPLQHTPPHQPVDSLRPAHAQDTQSIPDADENDPAWQTPHTDELAAPAEEGNRANAHDHACSAIDP